MKHRSAAMLLMTASLVALVPTLQKVGAEGPPACGPCGVAPSSTQPATAPSALSDAEKRFLLAMRREEKLAHDVYVTLGRKFDLMPLRNIPRSELQHQRVMASLLEQHGLADPVQSLPEGTFDDPAVQTLFDRLIAKGNESEVAALQVGAEIEEMDIKDLRAASARTTNAQIKDTFAALERASENHLRAFARNLTARKAAYKAAHLEQTEFDRIANLQRGKGGPH